MNILDKVYQESLTLLTDLYQLNMAYGYWKSGKAEQEAVFHVFFRKNPFHGGFTVACGLEYVMAFLENFGFSSGDIDFLGSLKSTNGDPLYEEGFLSYLANLSFTCDIDAAVEGSILFPHEPMLRITGSILQAQLIETPLLNILNFQSLVATKAARTHLAAEGAPVLEFGLRRAQGVDGALSASRAAYIGGCTATSNVLAGKLFDIPVKGTHAHSWVMSFDTEIEAFDAYADAMPDNCIFLVDTYDSLNGVKNAIAIGKKLRAKGKELIGVRLDSGDLAYLSIAVRKLLDEAGFTNTKIIASNDLDEQIITSLKKEQNACIDSWGIGTKLITAYDQPALGAVCKLSAIKSSTGRWVNKIKLSEQAIKVNNPGIQQVRRFYVNKMAVADMIFDIETEFNNEMEIIDPLDATRKKKIDTNNLEFIDILKPIYRKGKIVYSLPSIQQIKNEVITQLNSFHNGVKRFTHPHKYPVGLESSLYQNKNALILKQRQLDDGKKA